MSFEFYALPDEQRQWLAEIVSQEGIWCLVNSWKPGHGDQYYCIHKEAELKSHFLPITPKGTLMFFIGRTGLSKPVWRDSPRGKELDFIRSQAIEFSPSLIVRESILLEGRLAIMRPSEYSLHGIDPNPLSRWYRPIRKSLTSIMTKDYIVVQRTTTGEIKEWHEIGVTHGAVTWRLGGHLLKQFPQGAVEFDINQLSNK